MNLKQRIEALKNGEPVKVVIADQLYTTPKDLASRMVDELLGGDRWQANNLSILEPQAGTGVLLGAIGCAWHPNGSMTAVEINHRLANDLEVDFPLANVMQADFLEVENLGLFDRIIMNPPFKNGVDIQHSTNAANGLVDDGRLVAICADGGRQRAKLKPLAEDSGGFYEPLPSGTFKHADTMVNTALLVIEA